MKKRTRSTMKVSSSRDWSEFVDLLGKNRVKYVIVGAHALAVHGRARHTGDLDVFIEATPKNAARLAQALRDFGFDAHADAAAAFATRGPRGKMMSLGREPTQIDIMNDISGVSFKEAWKGRTKKRFGKRRVGFIGRKQYVKNKKASAKNPARTAKDLADLALLAEAPGLGLYAKPKRSHAKRKKGYRPR